MKFYLTVIRRDGKRLPPEELAQPPRLASLALSSKRGFRHLSASCCFGGSTLGELWEPVLSGIGGDDFTLHGFERMGEAGHVQEWRLKPHSVSTGGMP
jgi:hypothetical protein